MPVLRGGDAVRMLGGAGNVAANVASLGGQARLVAVVGCDAEAGEVRAAAAAEGLATGALVEDAARPTSIKTRLVAQRQQILRLDAESTAPLTGSASAALEAAFTDALAGAQLVVLSDYGKGVLTGGGAERLIARARAARLPVLIDPKGSDYARYAGADFVTPNLKELREAAGAPVETDADLEAAARRLITAHGFKAVVATRSEKGVSVVTAASALHIPAEAQEVYDVSGAGDTVMAALALALAAGASLEDAAALANVAAGVAVSRLGTAHVTAGELAEALRGGDGRAPEAGDDAAADFLLRTWRDRGLSIGFTNGCFDILHPGHVALLAHARAACDRLVVGLNSDASVRRLKGETRPIQGQASRAAVLAALRSVDLVLVFEEDTPEALIRRVAPDVLVKGADYTVDQVVGADFVLSRGGRVELAPLIAGQSTTAIAGRMAG